MSDQNPATGPAGRVGAEVARLLADRYAIERELGRGGMATVFLARDLKHRRQVAIKVLHPELAVSVGAERFLREIEIAAGLSHPHVLPMHDSGEAGGFVYYVMPYVEGESLRDRLDRVGALPVAEAIEIARNVTSALAHAHGRGVIHRDIKPENILLTGGVAVVADFGIAKAVGSAASVTQTGMSVGSPLYMSPEQAFGEREVDGRSDLYSLGCVLFEMLTGVPPFAGPHALAIMARHANESPPSLLALRPDLPEALERIVRVLMAKLASERFAGTAELLEALSSDEAALRLPTPSAPVAAMPAARSAAPPAGSLAVLPFRDLSPAADQEYFCEGVAEDVLATLAKTPGMRVASRTSSFSYKGRQTDVRTIGRELNVAAVLEGSVQRIGERMKVSVELCSTADGYQIWSERYTRESTDVFALQDDIATSIAQSLRITLSGGGDRVTVKRHTKSLAAYEEFLKGRHFWNNRAAGGLQNALAAFQRALEIDPLYPLPYIGLAQATHALTGYEFIPAPEAVPRLIGLATKATSIDDTLAEAHATLGAASCHYLWKWEEGMRGLQRAIDLEPDLAVAHFWFAQVHLARGDFDTAIAMQRHSIALDPLSMPANATLGWTYSLARRHDEAIGHLDTVTKLAPDLPLAAAMLGNAQVMAGQYAEAMPALERGAAMPGAGFIRAFALGRLGRSKDALAALDAMEARSPNRWLSPYGRALAFVGIGDTDSALTWIERAADEMSFPLSFAGVSPLLDDLRGEPRFARVLERIGISTIAGALR